MDDIVEEVYRLYIINSRGIRVTPETTSLVIHQYFC